ncbi:MAG: hypothetical protein RBQ77_05880 [Candidatus Methanomethylophilaceae archaeon]|jgi:hypothetical protein|nr:hypothetical protein [Candidatus Methanomethylophilaceae archaeon]
MGHVDIEYRFSGRPIGNDDIRRKSTGAMEMYLKDLVGEMRSADIPASYVSSFAVEGEENMVFVNGARVPDILDGLRIVMAESEDQAECGTDRPRMVSFGRPVLDWNRDHIEDVPDILMKNAISKAYADSKRAML